MAQASLTPLVAKTGMYVTDGKRLAEVLGVDDGGKVFLEDCSSDCGSDEPGAILTLSTAEFAVEWKPVRGS